MVDQTKAHWVSDLSVSECLQCSTPFTVFLRRHHCRACGACYCNQCTLQRAAVPRVGIRDAVRVCDVCFELLAYAARIDDLLAAASSTASGVEATRMANRLEHLAARRNFRRNLSDLSRSHSFLAAEFNGRLLQCGGIDLLFQLGASSTLASVRCKVARALSLLMTRRPAYRKAIFDRGVLELLEKFFVATVALPPAPAPALAARPAVVVPPPLQHAATSSALERRRDKSTETQQPTSALDLRHSYEPVAVAASPAESRARIESSDSETVAFLCAMLAALLDRDDGIAAAAAQRIAASRLVAFVIALVLSPSDNVQVHAAAAVTLQQLLRWQATRDVALAIGVLRPLILIALEAEDTMQLCAVQSFAYLVGVDAGAGSSAVAVGVADKQIAEQKRIAELTAGGALLPLIELCRSSSTRVRATAVQIMARLAVGERERLLLARHCLLDALQPILAADADAEVTMHALDIVKRVAGDARCAAEARLGAIDDGGVGARLVRAVVRALARDAALMRAGVSTLHALLLVDGDWTSARGTPLWKALRDGERRVVIDAMRVIVQAAVDRHDEGRGKTDADANDHAFLATLEKLQTVS